MIILGIDPGLKICGYAVIRVDQDQEQLLEAGVIRTDEKTPLSQRLVQISLDIDAILDKFTPQTLALEQLYAHYKHPRTAILMGHARGVIMERASRAETEVRDFEATRIKKSLTGNGRASKLQMQRTVQTLLGLAAPPEPADVADAIAVALCCANEMKR